MRKSPQTFPMKRTAWVEIPAMDKIVIGTPYKKKEYKINKNYNDCINLVTLERFKESEYRDNFPAFFIEDLTTEMGQEKPYFVVFSSEKGNLQEIGQVTLGETKRFTCTVPEEK